MTDIPKHAVIFCHPRRNSFTGAVADAYRAAIEEIGHEVCLRDLYRMGFDPVLKDEERPGEPGFHLHADVAEELRILSGARVFVLIYPIWFGTPPAMLKGYVERVFGSGFSHRDMREQHQNCKCGAVYPMAPAWEVNSFERVYCGDTLESWNSAGSQATVLLRNRS